MGGLQDPGQILLRAVLLRAVTGYPLPVFLHIPLSNPGHEVLGFALVYAPDIIYYFTTYSNN